MQSDRPSKGKSFISELSLGVVKPLAIKILYLVTIPAFFLMVIIHVFSGFAKRAVSSQRNADPNAELPAKEIGDPIGNDFNSQSISLIPSTGGYHGDIFGYFKYFFGGWRKSLAQVSERIGKTVFTTNVGSPVIVCGDHKSAETLFKDVSNFDHSHEINLICTRGTAPIFATKGPDAVNARRFIQYVLAASPDDKKYKAGLNSIRADMEHWAGLSSSQLKKMKVEDAVSRLILNFSSNLLLDASLNRDLIAKVFPVPSYLPKYPVVPAWLFPSYHLMPDVLSKLFTQMKNSPNWLSIQAAASEVGLSDRQAFKHLFTAISFNASGLSNPIINGILLTSLMPEQGRRLLGDDSLLDSFVWELMRHNGPTVMMKLADDTLITTAAGDRYLARSGNTVMCNTAMAQRDPTQWKDPQIFRADRFKDTLSNQSANVDNGGATEPLPTLGFGCPIGHIDDAKQRNNSHQCPFMSLAHPLVKDFLLIFIQEFRCQIEPSVLDSINLLKGDNVFDVDFDLSSLRGGPKATEDMVPNIPGGIRFSSFSIKEKC
tara:strand:- start:3275 stop:4906 length:1632 start_codon:yes stop_codon:yes gene_type:complete